jgi:hypothetical protein
MRKGDIVRFKEVIDEGDDELRMVVLEDEDDGCVLVQTLVGMRINPTSRYNVTDLVIFDSVSRYYHLSP